MEAIRLADFEKDLKIFPKGLDTLVVKRVFLFRVVKTKNCNCKSISKNPDILILDDCMSAVDGRTEKNIMNSISENRKGKQLLLHLIE